MPFIISRVNRPISREQERELKTWMGKAIQLVPGKSEEYLLLGFEDNCRLWLRGSDTDSYDGLSFVFGGGAVLFTAESCVSRREAGER